MKTTYRFAIVAGAVFAATLFVSYGLFDKLTHHSVLVDGLPDFATLDNLARNLCATVALCFLSLMVVVGAVLWEKVDFGWLFAIPVFTIVAGLTAIVLAIGDDRHLTMDDLSIYAQSPLFQTGGVVLLAGFIMLFLCRTFDPGAKGSS